MRNRWIQTGFAIAVLMLTSGATAQVATTPNHGFADGEELPVAEEVDERAIWVRSVDCTLTRPSDVQGYDIQCTNASFLDARHADFFIPGDHFQSKLKAWDWKPNTAVTTSPGPGGVFGVPARVYNYGGTPENPRYLHVYLECTYIHGVNIFPAGSTITLSSDGNCAVVGDPIRSRIDRSP